jgi:hypothetical protein
MKQYAQYFTNITFVDDTRQLAELSDHGLVVCKDQDELYMLYDTELPRNEGNKLYVFVCRWSDVSHFFVNVFGCTDKATQFIDVRTKNDR